MTIMSLKSSCPYCQSDELLRSHRRNLIESAMSFLLLPWRCYDCNRRFFRPSWIHRHTHAA